MTAASLADLHAAQDAALAADGIPLHYGDLAAEYHAALDRAVLMDRSHEARLEMTGAHRLDLMHRMSTNDLNTIPPGAGRATVFTNATARILDRVTVYNLGERALVLGEPGRGAALVDFLRRSIFFGDDVQVASLAPATHQIELHGPQAGAVLSAFWPQAASAAALQAADITIAGMPVTAARRKAASALRWSLVVSHAHSAVVWGALLEAGKKVGLIPAGSLTYNTLRIRAGLPAAGRELSSEYLPLEIGLWDEVSFSKGCYTGQEVIARMESRGRLARTIVRLDLARMVEAPAPLYHEGKQAGQLTSSVVSPDGEIFALGVVRLPLAQPGLTLAAGSDGISTAITALIGAQPPWIADRDDQSV